MLTHLVSLIEDIAVRPNKLILLVGEPRCGKTALLTDLAQRRGSKILTLGVMLGQPLAALPQRQRPLHVNSLLRRLADEYARDNLLLLDNLELLFDRSLKLDPLHLLKQLAHARRVVAAWPGQLREGRLTYADRGHPEYQEYGPDSWLPFELDTKP
jgi:hypothetical protein